jgi:hypothetical protein
LRDAKRVQVFARRHPWKDGLRDRFHDRGHGRFSP